MSKNNNPPTATKTKVNGFNNAPITAFPIPAIPDTKDFVPAAIAPKLPAPLSAASAASKNAFLRDFFAKSVASSSGFLRCADNIPPTNGNFPKNPSIPCDIPSSIPSYSSKIGCACSTNFFLASPCFSKIPNNS